MMSRTPSLPKSKTANNVPAYLSAPGPFIRHYLRGRPAQFVGLVLMVLGAGGCGVAVQYVLKLLVDAMTVPGQASAAWTALLIFAALIAGESVLWRLSGWHGWAWRRVPEEYSTHYGACECRRRSELPPHTRRN